MHHSAWPLGGHPIAGADEAEARRPPSGTVAGVKRLYHGSVQYQRSKGFCAAVNARASEVDAQCGRHARAIDAEVHHPSTVAALWCGDLAVCCLFDSASGTAGQPSGQICICPGLTPHHRAALIGGRHSLG